MEDRVLKCWNRTSIGRSFRRSDEKALQTKIVINHQVYICKGVKTLNKQVINVRLCNSIDDDGDRNIIQFVDEILLLYMTHINEIQQCEL